MIQEGRKNKALATVWNSLPNEENEKDGAEKYQIHLPTLLPQNQTSLHYDAH